MVSGRFKSRTFRRVKRNTPGGKPVIHYKKRKPSTPKCGGCGNQLKGLPRARPIQVQRTPKSARTPQRPYGGNLCSACMRKTIIQRIRS